jgi:hypothetical protein
MRTGRRNFVYAVIPLFIVALGGCGEPETVVDHMQRHFADVTAVQMAVIAGDLAALREPAEWLAGHEAVEGLPGEWAPYVAAMQAAAQRAADAGTITAAAAATGEMGLACGGCHRALDEGGQFTYVDPPEEPGTVGHMQRHKWAVDRMWEGLIAASDTEWMMGVDGLAEAALRPAGAAEDLAELAERVHALGAQAGEVADVRGRALVYGQILATCADCHQRAGRGPASRQADSP